MVQEPTLSLAFNKQREFLENPLIYWKGSIPFPKARNRSSSVQGKSMWSALPQGSFFPVYELGRPPASSPLCYRWGNWGPEEQKSKLAEVTSLGKLHDSRRRTEEWRGGDGPLSAPCGHQADPHCHLLFPGLLFSLSATCSPHWGQSDLSKLNITMLLLCEKHFYGLGAVPSIQPFTKGHGPCPETL